MRRLVAISRKSVVVVGLLLAGTIYLAAEDTQAAQQVISTPNAAIHPTKADGLSIARGSGPAAVSSNSSAIQPLDDEPAAEQQAAQLPAQKPAKTQAQDIHTRLIVIS